MAVRIEDAGFEIRDMIAWVYGSGFPKSHNLKDKWQGWGTALKPALEPITVARKPLGEKTVASNVLEHGTGAINVDGCRVGTETWTRKGGDGSTPYGSKTTWNTSKTPDIDRTATGRWPANLIHDGSDEVVGLFPDVKTGNIKPHNNAGSSFQTSNTITGSHKGDSGSAARFFYCAKASKKDRDEGCEGLEEVKMDIGDERPSGGSWERRGRDVTTRSNHHPTVKPTDLMRYLCRLVTPPQGIVLDPFMGSGSTGKAAVLEGFQFIGIEREGEYLDIATRRIADASPLSGLRNILDSSP
jgi:site-specific DNA-methyltransferase (adenine-specific)